MSAKYRPAESMPPVGEVSLMHRGLTVDEYLKKIDALDKSTTPSARERLIKMEDLGLSERQ